VCQKSLTIFCLLSDILVFAALFADHTACVDYAIVYLVSLMCFDDLSRSGGGY